MNILHIIDSNGIYGAEVMVLHLIEEQQRMGLAPQLLSISDGGTAARPLEDAARERGVAVRTLVLDRGFSFRSARSLVRAARELGARLLHCHGYKATILLASLPRSLRTMPVVRTLHGWTATRRFSRNWLYDMLDRLALVRADAVVDVNPAGRNPLVAGRPRQDRRLVIENGIPELTFRAQDVLKEDLGVELFADSGFTIGAVCRLSEEKGLLTLLDALARLRGGQLPFRAVIIGEGPQRRELEERIAALGLTDMVLLAGYRSEAYHYLPLFDVFVLPSTTEGLPVTLLEAMQAQVPVVASRVGGIPRVLDQGACGIMIEPGDAGGLANAIYAVRSDPSRAAEMCRRARKAVLERYSSQRMAAEYLRVYEQVLGPGREDHA